MSEEETVVGFSPSSGPVATPDLYFLHVDGASIGPVPVSDVGDMIRRGRVHAGTRVARVGAPDWTELGAVAELRGFLAPPPAARPQPFPAPSPAPAFFAPAPVAPAAALPSAPPAAQVEYGGFMVRLIAYLGDGLILYILSTIATFVVMFCFELTTTNNDPRVKELSAAIWGFIVQLVVACVYYAWFVGGKWQATPGKRVMGLYIIRTDGEKMTASTAIGRYFAYILSALPLGLGFLIMLWGNEGKTFHDALCKTRVVVGTL